MKKRILGFIVVLTMMIGCVPIVVMAEESVFTDVSQSHWAYEVINELTNEGVINGMGDGTFVPEGFVTREQFMKLLVCALNCDTNSVLKQELFDVSDNNWSKPYIYAGIERGIYNIDEFGSYFNPTAELKRGVSAEWIIDGLGVTSEAENIFSDVPNYGKQSESIASAAKIGIVAGYEDNTFRAENTITRAEAAALIKRVMDYQTDLYSLRKDSKNEIEIQDDVEVAESSKSVNVPMSVDEKNKTISFSKVDETLMNLGTGDILFIPPCDNMPNGFAGKVASVSGSKNNTKIKFEEPKLAEVVQSVDISTYVSAGIDNYADDGGLTAISEVKGVPSKENGMNIEGRADANADIDISWHGVKVYAGANADEKATVHFETESYKEKDGFYAAIDMSMKAKVDIHLETDNFAITKFEASADLLTDVAAVGGYNNSFSKEYTYELPTCNIPVSGLFNINIYSNLIVQADGSLNIEATADFDNDMGAKFTIDDGFTTHNTTNASAGITVDAEGSLKMGPKEELKLTFCGVELMGKTFFDGISLLEADAAFGIGANGKTTIDKEVNLSDDGISFGDYKLKHMCWFCIEGDIIRYFNGSVGVGEDVQNLINKFCDKELSYTFADSEDKISDWHLSTGDGYTLEFEMQKCPHYEMMEDEDELLNAFIDKVVGRNSDYLYFLPADYDNDGNMEAFGITGSGLGEEIYSNVKIWFIDSDGNCILAKSDIYGVLDEPITVSNGSFISWCVTAGGSGSQIMVLGVKDGDLFEPSVSEKYAGFGGKGSDYIFSDDSDFEKLNCDYIAYRSYFKDGGGHMWEPIAFDYDTSTREFLQRNNTSDDYNYNKILNGDFSDFATIWRSSAGDTVFLHSDGTIGEGSESESKFEYKVEDITYETDGSYSWTVAAYYNSNIVDGIKIILYPKGVEVMSWNGNIVPTDVSQVRLWSGNGSVSDNSNICYKL